MSRTIWRWSWLALLALVVALAACGTNEESAAPADNTEGVAASGPITVASKQFTEAYILGEIYAQLLEENGFTVERQLGLGSEALIHEAMLRGDVDLYPEYTSTGLLVILKEEPLEEADAIYETVKSGYESQFNITWLDRAPFNNSQTLAVRPETAEELGISTMSDLAAVAPQLRVGGPPEFYEREDGLSGVQAHYGPMEFAEEVQVDAGLRYQALLDNEIDAVVAFGTDGQIGGYNLVALEDDRNLWPIYQVAPVIRQETLAANPRIAEILNPVAPILTNEVMADLNWMVDGPDQMEYQDVARNFIEELKETGIITTVQN